ncbi:MAG: extracellular catalytic domain type 2 short-chain-length polyhydroxyalkanoate depolymerase [Burkholderiaceae bacterium]
MKSFQLSFNKACAAIATICSLSLVSAVPAQAATVTLSKYNADPATLTVSGISSGGYAAVQFQVAYSSKFHGAAIFAGGPYYCAQNNVNNGTGYCESGSGIPLSTLESYTDQQVSAGTIDNTSNLVNMPVYMFSGTNDTTVKQAVMNTLQQYYQHYGVKTIHYDNQSTAAHAWISPDGPNSCNSSYSPYINNCSDTPDPEKTFLTMFYGTLNAKNTGTLGGSYVQFNQNEFCPNSTCSGIDMDTTGWAYVPANCANGQTCKVHLAIHGCVQYQGIIQQQFVQKSGINEWADTNNIIVVYPQLIAQGDNTKAGYNPNGCWDFWGYNGSDYALRSGKQMVAVMAMINRITSGFSGGGTTTTTTAGGTTTTTTATTTTTTAAGACYNASNYTHVSAGRAYLVYSTGHAAANGSNQDMGLDNTYVMTKLRQKGTNYYVIDSTCP